MKAQVPIVFLAFANDMDAYLANLKNESRAVFDALQPLEQHSAIGIHREESASFDELYDDLLAFDGRIVLFHYAGHADGSMLQLEGSNGGAGGIAKLLGQQAGLKLVFLNGCATKDQVKLLHDTGVPAVIATAVKIDDAKATNLASAFYAALAKGHSIFEAFDSACAYVQGKFELGTNLSFSVNRSPNFDFDAHERENTENYEFEWTLYTREDCEEDLKQWRLSSAQQDWLLTLQDPSGRIRDIEDKPITIAQQSRTRSIEVLSCANCHCSTSLTEDSQSYCPICGSDELAKEQSQSTIPELSLAFDIDKDQARKIALIALGITQAEHVSLRKVLAPYWVFDLDIRSRLSGQRGVIKDIHAETLALTWEDVSEDIELSLSSFMVPGFTTKSHSSVDLEDWYWPLDEASAISQLNHSIPFIPLTASTQEAFDAVSAYVNEALADEAVERIGGAQQKNISFQTRYRELSVRSVFLPHWCAVITHQQNSSSVIINGQSGAIRFSQSPDKPALSDQRHLSMNQKRAANSSLSEKPSHWISIFSGAGIGIMVGLLMGLAAPQGADAKSVVSIFIGAVGVGLAALLGLNDRHFSAAKGLRIGSFGLAVAVSALSGIYVRDNNMLSPGIEERAKTLRAALHGVDNQQIIDLLVGTTTTIKSDGSTVQARAALDARSALFNASGVDRSVCDKLNEPEWRSSDWTLQEVKEQYRLFDNAKNSWGKFIDVLDEKLPASQADQKAMLFIARDAACGNGEQIQAFKPSSPECKAILENANDPEAIKQLFTASETLMPVLNSIRENVSADNNDIALQLLVPILCSSETAP